MRFLARLTALVLTFSFTAVSAAGAATIPYRTDSELVALADRVVRGRVLDSTVERTPAGLIRTRTRIAVVEDFTGEADPVITVYELGGRLPDAAMTIPGAPRFARGEDVILCLERAGDGFRTVALSFSAFRVATGARVDRFVAGAAIVGAPAGPEPVRTLEAFRAVVAAVKGVRSRPVLSESQAQAQVAAAARAPIAEPFTLLGPGRWREADSDVTIHWFRNTLRPSPIQGDTDGEISVALHAWTAAPARISLAFGGTRSDDGPLTERYCTEVNQGVGLITFGDPANTLPAGVLAIGGFCSTIETHVVSGTAFEAITHGLIVMNDTLQGYNTPPNVTRVLEHEVGHAIGLGHNEGDTSSIMFPSCCHAATPVPPALGGDDIAAVLFIYPLPDIPVCHITLQGSPHTTNALGGPASVMVTTSLPTCQWQATSTAPWVQTLGPEIRVGSGQLNFRVDMLIGTTAARSGALVFGPSVTPASLPVTQTGDADTDGDGLRDLFERIYDINYHTHGPDDMPTGDPDGDGVSNLDEQNAGTHPRGTVRRYLAEGVSNAFFDTEIALFNPTTSLATAVLRIQPESGAERTWAVYLGPGDRRTVPASVFESLTTAPFATLIESEVPIVVDRTVRWDATGYGAHAETAVEAPSTTWFLAEGSTAGDFQLFYLLQNPNATTVTATIRYLRPAPLTPIEQTVSIAPRARLTIPVDTVSPGLASADVSGIVTASLPIIVERAMYLSRPGQPFAAGHGSAGVTAPATEWFLAEGATGSFFDLFLLIANPSSQAASVRVEYLLPGGGTLTKDYAVAAESRFTVWVDEEQLPAGSGQKPLASTSVGMRITSTNGVPIIVERAMWWPQPVWYEAHNAAGTTVTGTRWALAAGLTGGPNAAETYVLIANTSATAGTARVSVYKDDWFANAITREVALPPNSRTNVAIGVLFPEVAGWQFGTLVESIGATPAQLVVERAMYASPGGVTWAAGTSAVATRLP